VDFVESTNWDKNFRVNVGRSHLLYVTFPPTMQFQPLLSYFVPYFSSIVTQRQELKARGTTKQKNKQVNKKLSVWVVSSRWIWSSNRGAMNLWDLTPCSQGKILLATCCSLVSLLDYSSTLKIGELCSSETSVDFYRTTRRYIPDDRNLRACLFFAYWIVELTGMCYLRELFYQSCGCVETLPFNSAVR
jgi:hypothetical protein